MGNGKGIILNRLFISTPELFISYRWTFLMRLRFTNRETSRFRVYFFSYYIFRVYVLFCLLLLLVFFFHFILSLNSFLTIPFSNVKRSVRLRSASQLKPILINLTYFGSMRDDLMIIDRRTIFRI